MTNQKLLDKDLLFSKENIAILLHDYIITNKNL